MPPLDPEHCAHLCCDEHLVQCGDDGMHVISEAGDAGLKECSKCGVKYCPPHLDWHSCEWQTALRQQLAAS